MSLINEGQIIKEKWEVERFLGEGAFAEVYRVKHRFFRRQAMKVFKDPGMTMDDIKEMLHEAIYLSEVHHPNIIRVFDADVVDTSKGICGFFTMEYVPEGTLEDFWRSHNDEFVPIQLAVEIIKQVCCGLVVAHNNNPPIVHRDIKPQNILVGYDNLKVRARLSDFGLAKKVDLKTWVLTGLGTRAFKSPEVLQNIKKDSCAGDVWALGTILYLLLTDYFPYTETDDFDFHELNKFERQLKSPSEFNIHVDRKLDKIVQGALHIDHEKRYQNAMEFLEELSSWELSGTKSKRELKKEAEGLAYEAIQTARNVQYLEKAVFLMEEAFVVCPALRGLHEQKVQLWRKGVSG